MHTVSVSQDIAPSYGLQSLRLVWYSQSDGLQHKGSAEKRGTRYRTGRTLQNIDVVELQARQTRLDRVEDVLYCDSKDGHWPRDPRIEQLGAPCDSDRAG